MGTNSGFQVLSSIKSDLKIRNYKKQRSHRKSKTGCIPCKVKRVKCDEFKPICDRCRKSASLCAYQEPCERKAVYMPRSNPHSVLSCSFDSKNGTSGSKLLGHFYANFDLIFNIPGRDELASLSHTNSLIRHTLLAITACHLRHMSPETVEHRIAEHFHQSLAIRDFQAALETPPTILGQQGVNALLMSALLLNMIAFTLPPNGAENDPESSFVYSSGEDRLGWLALQAGLRPLLLSLSAYLETKVEFLHPFMFGHRTIAWAVSQNCPGSGIVPEIWIKAFKLKEDDFNCASHADANHNDVLLCAAILIAYLRRIDPSRSEIFLNLMFLTKIQGNFRSLLYNRDERALWLFGYWLGIMSRYEGIWWCERRVKRDYQAIYMWLDSLNLSGRAGVEGIYWKGMMQELKIALVFTPG